MIGTRQGKNICWLIRILPLVSLLVIISACSDGLDEQEYLGRARSYLESNDLNSATIELKNILLKNANNAEARYLLGEIYLKLGDLKSAEKELRRSLEAGWDEAAVQLSLAEAMYRQGKFQIVLDDIPIKDSYPDIVKADLLGILAASKSGLDKWDEAEEAISTGESITGSSLWLFQSKIRLEIHRNNLKSADQMLEHALLAHPGSQDLWLLRAGLSEGKGDLENTDMALQKVIDLDPPKNITAWERQARLGQCKIRIRQKDFVNARIALNPLLQSYPGDAEANFLDGLIAYTEGDLDLAEERLLKVFKVVPDHYGSLLLYGNLKYSQQDYQQAAYYLERAVSSHTEDVSTQTLLGKTYFKLGQYDEAGKRLEFAASRSGDNAELLALLGVTRFEQGDTRTAILELEKAAAAAPEDTGIRNVLAKAYIDTGNTERAISELESILEESGKNLHSEALLLIAHLRVGEFDKALELTDKLAEQLPDSPLPQSLAGHAYEGKKDFVSARRSYEAALKLNADYSMASLGLARLDLIAGDAGSARNRYHALLETQPNNADALVALARLSVKEQEGEVEEILELLEKARKVDEKSLESRLILANYYLYNGMAEEALVYATEAMMLSPRHPLAMLVLGRAQLGTGDVSSVNTMKKLTSRLPESADAHYYLAVARARFDDLPGTRQSLLRALELKPDHESALHVLAKLELNSGHFDSALKIAQQLTSSHPESKTGYLMEGDILLAQDDKNAALSAYQSALARSKVNNAAAIRISRLQRKRGDIAASHTVLQNWLEQHPEDFAVRFVLASSYLAAGNEDMAMGQLEQILDKQPDNPSVLNDLAWLYHQKGKSGALEMAEKAYRLAPDSPAIQDTYGWILVQTGKIESGLIPLEQAVSNAPENPDIRYHLAAALAKAGDKDRAKEELSSILQSGRQFSERAEALALQKELE